MSRNCPYEIEHLPGEKHCKETFGIKNEIIYASSKTSSSHTQKNLIGQAVSPYSISSDTTMPPAEGKSVSRANMELKQSSADWTEVFDKLTNAIKMRHYSHVSTSTFRVGLSY